MKLETAPKLAPPRPSFSRSPLGCARCYLKAFSLSFRSLFVTELEIFNRYSSTRCFDLCTSPYLLDLCIFFVIPSLVLLNKNSVDEKLGFSFNPSSRSGKKSVTASVCTVCRPKICSVSISRNDWNTDNLVRIKRHFWPDFYFHVISSRCSALKEWPRSWPSNCRSSNL